MMNPTLIATPFAENGDKNTIPESVGAEPQNATMQAGFPPITQEKISAGGIPPERNDFNGILNALSQHTVFLNKGGRYGFDAEFAAKIRGYEKGAYLTLDDGTQVVSEIDANTNDPNTNMTGWVFPPIKAKASDILDESGLTQQDWNNGVESVADLALIQNPKDGNRVYVKSYHKPTNLGLAQPYIGGGWRVYVESRKAENDGVLCINGWVLQIDNNTIETTQAGFISGSVDSALIIKKCLAALKKMGGGTLNLTDGVYLLTSSHLTKDPTPNQSTYRFFFEPVSNVTIQGSRNAILKIADKLVDEDAMYRYAKGYQVFSDHLLTSPIYNFKLKGFQFDGNVANNLLIPQSSNPYNNQSMCQFTYFDKTHNFEASDLYIHHTSGRQVFCIKLGCTGLKIHDNTFEENGNINGNVNLTDHSTIYNESDDYLIFNNRFKNIGFDTVSTAIEAHGKVGKIYGNDIENYNLASIRAAMLSDSNDVLVYANTGRGLTTAMMFDAANGYTLKAKNFGNIFEMRSVAQTGTRTLAGINTAGQFASGNTGNHYIELYDNTFVAKDGGIAIVGGKVPYLESRNTFRGFTSYMQHGARSMASTSKIVLHDIISGITQSSLLSVFDWDSQLNNYTVDVDINVRSLTGSPNVNTVVMSQSEVIKITGFVGGRFTQSLLPYRGSWGASNTLQSKIITSVFSRDTYSLPVQLSCTIETLTATYTKLAGSSATTSLRRSQSTPTTVQNGGDKVGDIVYALTPVTHLGWVCTVASASPNVLGTWKAFAPIQ